MKDFLTGEELDAKQLQQLLDSAIELKKQQESGQAHKLLEGKTLAMIFEKPSTRTRISFETGVFQLGGHALYLSPNDLQLSRGETIEDTAQVLSRYVDIIMARVFAHSTIEALANNASVPVINGLTDEHHPCQTLADLQTILEHKGQLEGIKVAWIGDGNNVCDSFLIGAAKTGVNVAVATPKGFEPNAEVVKAAQKNIEVELTDNPSVAVKDADVVMTDVFVSMHDEASKEKKFLPKYQVNAELMKQAKPDAVFMHCLPAKRGKEVTDEVIDSKQSVVFDQAENRLHAQKALMVMLLLGQS